MKINLAKSAGFCFGVKRAINIALRTLKTGNKVCVLGDLVHNEDVMKEIKKAGIKKIKHLTKGKNKILLIRAHGACRAIIDKAGRLGYKIIDATCPMVKEIHRIAVTMEKRGYKIIVIGDKKHDEVHGIAGQLKTKAIVIDRPKRSPLITKEKIKKACVVVQSTQSRERAVKAVGILRQYVPELKFFNTICQPTLRKQEEIKIMPSENDVMLIIGSKNSANTKRLYEISKSLNQRSFWVGSKKEINPVWFKNAQSVGITAGASTPDSTTQGVINYIKRIT